MHELSHPFPPLAVAVRRHRETDLATTLAASLGSLSPASRVLYLQLMRLAVAQAHEQELFTAPVEALGFNAGADEQRLKQFAREFLATGLEWTSRSVGSSGRVTTTWSGGCLLSSFAIWNEADITYAQWSYAPPVREEIFAWGERLRLDAVVLDNEGGTRWALARASEGADAPGSRQ